MTAPSPDDKPGRASRGTGCTYEREAHAAIIFTEQQADWVRKAIATARQEPIRRLQEAIAMFDHGTFRKENIERWILGVQVTLGAETTSSEALSAIDGPKASRSQLRRTRSATQERKDG